MRKLTVKQSTYLPPLSVGDRPWDEVRHDNHCCHGRRKLQRSAQPHQDKREHQSLWDGMESVYLRVSDVDATQLRVQFSFKDRPANSTQTSSMAINCSNSTTPTMLNGPQQRSRGHWRETLMPLSNQIESLSAYLRSGTDKVHRFTPCPAREDGLSLDRRFDERGPLCN